MPLKPGQGETQGQQPGAAAPLSKNLSARKLGTDHALPGADGKTLPLVNGKPVLNGQNLPNDRSRKLLGKQGIVGGNQEATGNAGAAATGEQGTDQQKGKKFRKLPTVNGLPADNGLSAQEKFGKNNPNALSDQGNGKPKRLTRKDLSAGQSIVEPGDQGSANKGKKFGKLPTVNGEPADNRPSVQKHLRKNNPDVFSDQSQGSVDGNVRNRFRRLPTVNGEPADNGPSMQKRLRKNSPDVFSGENQGSASGNDGARKFRRPQNEEGSAGPATSRPTGRMRMRSASSSFRKTPTFRSGVCHSSRRNNSRKATRNSPAAIRASRPASSRLSRFVNTSRLRGPDFPAREFAAQAPSLPRALTRQGPSVYEFGDMREAFPPRWLSETQMFGFCCDWRFRK